CVLSHEQSCYNLSYSCHCEEGKFTGAKPMFDRKKKSSKKTADRAEITVTALEVTDQQRQQIEQDLASFDPTWDAGEYRMSVPLDATTQEQLGQLVSMFPNGDIRLQTTSGDHI